MLSPHMIHQWRTPARIPPLRPGRGDFVCPVQRLLAQGKRDRAESVADRRRYCAQHRVSVFQPIGDGGPWVASAFCASCESLRRNCSPDRFLRMPWAVDCRYRAMPICRWGPLAPSREFIAIEPMRAGWQVQAAAIAREIRRHQLQQTRGPCSVYMRLAAGVLSKQIGQQIDEGVLLLGFLQAGCSFGIVAGHVQVTIGEIESLNLIHRIDRDLADVSDATAEHPAPATAGVPMILASPCDVAALYSSIPVLS
jgi:hypothetical protein